MRKMRGYIFSRPFMGERVPQHVQNLVIRDYCKRKRLHYLLSATEYAMPKCHLMLEQVLDELAEIDGLVAYSLFQLPEIAAARRRVYERVFDASPAKCLHFAVEDLQAATWQDCQRVETLWQVRLTLPRCGQIDA